MKLNEKYVKEGGNDPYGILGSNSNNDKFGILGGNSNNDKFGILGGNSNNDKFGILGGNQKQTSSGSKYWDVAIAAGDALVKSKDANAMATQDGKFAVYNTGRVYAVNAKGKFMGTMEITGDKSYKIKYDDGDVYDSATTPVTTTPDATKPSQFIDVNIKPEEVASGSKLVKLGMKGDIVSQIQNLLISKGFKKISKKEEVDSKYGPLTKQAVYDFQVKNGLVKKEGVVGPETWGALNKKDTSSGMGDDSPEYLQAKMDADAKAKQDGGKTNSDETPKKDNTDSAAISRFNADEKANNEKPFKTDIPQPPDGKYNVGDIANAEIGGKKYKIKITSVNIDGTYGVDVEDSEGNITKTKINENNKLSILDLLFEDDNTNGGGYLLDDKGYQAILDFENSLGMVKDDGTGNFKPVGMGYISIKDKPQEQTIKEHISKSIGLDNWFKINPLFRTQIYSFMFNSDSDKNGDKYRWLGGLVQTIDSTFDRATIVKNSSDSAKPNTENAIKIVKESIESGKINSYYSQYLTTLDRQYQSVRDNNKKMQAQMNANYELLWSKRPKYIERLYNGEKISDILSGLKKSDGKTSAEKILSIDNSRQTNAPKITVTTNDTSVKSPSNLIGAQTLKVGAVDSLGPFKITGVIRKGINENMIKKIVSKYLHSIL